ncbi:MAG: SCO2322 family protein [Candidatus Nanopelagicales bacterium]
MLKVKRNVALVFIATLFSSLISVTSANAADYRYWTFWVTTSDQWSFANEGAGTLKATDQMVTGWKFAVTGADNGTPPNQSAVFSELCPDTSEQAGVLRVAVVVDFNDASVAPEGETPPSESLINCVTVNDGQTAADALNAAGLDVRANDGFVCGINGYPKEECGVEVPSTATETTEAETQADTPVVIAENEEVTESSNTDLQLIALAAVLVVGLAIVLRMRKKKNN